MPVDQKISKTVTLKNYLDVLPPERREVLELLRESIFRICPEVEETMSAGMPTFTLHGHPFLSLASRKNYVALYIVPHDLLNAFKTELRQYDHGRSCIRFKRLDPKFLGLLERIIRYTGSQLSTSKFFKKELSVEADEEVYDQVTSTR
jgi:uncharacterized protein YdhG (YjbR/CyaY superfamily)